MGMYDRHHQQQPPPPPQQQQPVAGMWSTDPFKVDSGGQATSGSTIMEGDTKFDHTGVSNQDILAGLLFLLGLRRSFVCTHFGCGLQLEDVPHMDELEEAGDADQEASKPRDKVKHL
jgi:transcription factor TGA